LPFFAAGAGSAASLLRQRRARFPPFVRPGLSRTRDTNIESSPESKDFSRFSGGCGLAASTLCSCRRRRRRDADSSACQVTARAFCLECDCRTLWNLDAGSRIAGANSRSNCCHQRRSLGRSRIHRRPPYVGRTRASSRRNNIERADRPDAETALKLAPINAAAWLLLSLLTRNAPDDDRGVSIFLEMSYFTAQTIQALACSG
jgi:hypothetical protein